MSTLAISRAIATSVKRSGVEVNSLPFFKGLPSQHQFLFQALEEEFEDVYIGGDYCQFLAQREKTYRSYCMILVIDIDNPYHAWDLIYKRLCDIVEKYCSWYIPTLDTNKTVRSEHLELEHYEFSFVDMRPNTPTLTFSVYKFKQDRTLEKSLLLYHNLFIILKHFKTPLSRVACHICDEESMMLYDFSSVYDFVREYHRAVCKGGCSECQEIGGKQNDYILSDARELQFAARKYLYCMEKPKSKIYMVPTLQACVLRRLMFDYNIHYHCGKL